MLQISLEWIQLELLNYTHWSSALKKSLLSGIFVQKHLDYIILCYLNSLFQDFLELTDKISQNIA